MIFRCATFAHRKSALSLLTQRVLFYTFFLLLVVQVVSHLNSLIMVVPSNPRREQVLKLIDEKDKIEKKISDLGVVLQQVRI